MLPWLPYIKIAKVGSNQPYNKIAFPKAAQVTLNSVPTDTHNQMVKVLPYSPPSVFSIYCMCQNVQLRHSP